MTEANDQRRGSTAAAWLAVAAMLLPVAYVLSIGLFAGVPYDPNSALSRFVTAFYSPLAWLTHSWPPLRVAMEWYLSLWQP